MSLYIRSFLAGMVLLLISASRTYSQIAMTTEGLQCESRENPLGIDVPQPRLSWVVKSPARGARQTAYQILAASSPDLLASNQADLWDSGQTKSDETLNIPYAGKPLASAARIYWKVRAWDGGGQPSVWSAPATWTMGVLTPEDWRGAKWIGAVAAPAESNRAGRGYHAGETADQNEEKWVQVDLGQSLPITAVRLHPVKHEGKDGFGFPVRFKVEVADEADFGQAEMVADQTGADFPNPGDKAVSFPSGAAPVQGRYVRVTATKLWMWKPEKYPFALSQLEVVSGGKNVAVGKAVAAKDSVDRFGWAKPSLTDGLGLISPNTAPACASAQLRRDFVVKPGLRRALTFVCGLGYYDMTLNGQKITQDLLTPGWSKYDKTCLYDTYDVTASLRAGTNAAGLCLGNAMYNVEKTPGRYTKFSGSYGPQKAIAQIRLEYQDGTVEHLVTDEQWRTAPGPITFTSVYGGEDCDARLEQRGWDRPGFDAAAWKPAVVTQGPGGTLKGLSCAAPAICAYDVFKPVQIKELRPGITVYDLGQNAAQMPTITVHGPAGSTVTLRPAELVNGDGSIDPQSTGRGGAICTYTLAGNGNETWSPKFFYSGYRYIQVERAPASGGNGALPVVDALQSAAVHTTATPVGEFTTSSDLFNRIYTLVRWAQLSNMVSVLTDCPHREKLGWLEQIHLNGPALRYNFDLNAFFNKTMNDMADSQRADGQVWTTAPTYDVSHSGRLRGLARVGQRAFARRVATIPVHGRPGVAAAVLRQHGAVRGLSRAPREGWHRQSWVERLVRHRAGQSGRVETHTQGRYGDGVLLRRHQCASSGGEDARLDPRRGEIRGAGSGHPRKIQCTVFQRRNASIRYQFPVCELPATRHGNHPAGAARGCSRQHLDRSAS